MIFTSSFCSCLTVKHNVLLLGQKLCLILWSGCTFTTVTHILCICPWPQCSSLTFMLHEGVGPPQDTELLGVCGHLLMGHTHSPPRTTRTHTKCDLNGGERLQGEVKAEGPNREIILIRITVATVRWYMNITATKPGYLGKWEIEQRYFETVTHYFHSGVAIQDAASCFFWDIWNDSKVWGRLEGGQSAAALPACPVSPQTETQW